MECLRDQFDNGVVLNGRYQTIAPLNHGSFGMVFMARDLQTTDTVAIKCLTKKSAAPEAGLDFAIDDKSEELILHSRLGSHPNIVNLLDSFETEAHIYIVLEFCPRGDLYEAIRHDHGPLETEHVRQFMLELVDSVAYIHSKGVFHRDIKPENIFLTQSSTMKLGDFGLATTDKWSYETTVGSDRYMSPEQYDSAGAGYSPAQADIWAIGICLLNILFSRNPFTMPTEADPLFLDFSRDKQSLFDVFPSMSQDTYEVIVECMNLDPSKRSLIGARNALRRVISFTTMDEALDDFSSADRRGLPASNREPLRTPSIQSPQVDTGAFPWAKALQTSPHHALRQLSVIPDDESYTEELFPKSEDTTDWCSATTAHTPSMASVLNSSLTNSMQSMAINRPQFQRSAARVSPMAGSLPINMTRPRNQQTSMSLVFGGHKDTVSKSWSDMWEEEVEEEEERQRQLQTLKELNSRTWSQDSKVNDENTPRQGLSPSAKATPINIASHLADITNQVTAKPIDDEDILADGFFFHDVSAKPVESPQRYSPPPKRSGTDKWSALGDRRRGATNTSSARSTPIKPSASVMMWTPRHVNGHDFASLGQGIRDHHPHQLSPQTHFTTSHTTTSPAPIKWTPGKERAKDCPWNKGRDWTRRRDRRDIGDVEWVGGWQDAHS